MKRVVLSVTVALAALLLPMDVARASVPVLVIEGRGWGHGVGMAQDGALTMGRQGATTDQILGHFYPGTGIGEAHGHVRVVVLTSGDGTATLGFPGGGELRSPASGPQHAGFPVPVGPGGSVVIRHAGGRYHVDQAPGAEPASAGPRSETAVRFERAWLESPLPLPTPTTTPPPQPPETTTTTTTTTTQPPRGGGGDQAPPAPAPPEGDPAPPGEPQPAPTGVSSPAPIWAVTGDTVAVPARNARYRGAVEATAAAGPLRLVNEVDVEHYLRGMGEVRDPSWPQAALEAQTIAARTYALRAMRASGEICDTQRCQVYLGQQAEYPAMDRAVANSRGRVLGYGGALASAVYSANAGGVSATTEEGFGTPDGIYPYLRAVDYPTEDPRPWRVEVAMRDVAARFGYPGTVERVSVSRAGPSGRALEVTLDGDAGPRAVAALTFSRQLGLRSTLYELGTATAEVAPDAPDPAEHIQAMPEDVEAVMAADLRTDLPRPQVRSGPVAITTPGGSGGPGGDLPGLVVLAFVVVAVAAGAVGLATVAANERRPEPQ